jgi:hypothetical protein
VHSDHVGPSGRNVEIAPDELDLILLGPHLGRLIVGARQGVGTELRDNDGLARRSVDLIEVLRQGPPCQIELPRLGVPAIGGIHASSIEDPKPVHWTTLHPDERHGPRPVKTAGLIVHLAEEPHPGRDGCRHGRSRAERRAAHRLVGHAPHDCARVVLVAGDHIRETAAHGASA